MGQSPLAPKEGDQAARREATTGSAESDEVFAVERNRSSAANPSKGARQLAKMPSSPGYASRSRWTGYQSKPR